MSYEEECLRANRGDSKRVIRTYLANTIGSKIESDLMLLHATEYLKLEEQEYRKIATACPDCKYGKWDTLVPGPKSYPTAPPKVIAKKHATCQTCKHTSDKGNGLAYCTLLKQMFPKSFYCGAQSPKKDPKPYREV